MVYPKVSIVIVNWNGIKYLKMCLISIFKQTYYNYEIILVDNCSIDDSIEYVRTIHPQVKIIKLDDNYGFAKANNIGIHEAFKEPTVEYIVTLNNDTMVDKYWLSCLVDVMEDDESIGSAQSKILFLHEKNMVNNVGITIYKDGSASNRGIYEKNIEYNNVEEIFGTCAASAIYRRKALIDVGLFDEEFFAYMEDVDLAWRLRLNNWKSFLVPNSIVYHVHSASSSSSKFKLFLINRNLILVLIKNLPLKYIFYFPINFFLLRLRFLKTKKERVKSFAADGRIEILIALIKAWLSVFPMIPSTLLKRYFIQRNKKLNKKEISCLIDRYSDY